MVREHTLYVLLTFLRNYYESSSLKNTYSFVGQKLDMVSLGYNQGVKGFVSFLVCREESVF